MSQGKPIDLRKIRERHGLGGLEQVTVTATDLAEMGYCEMRVILSELHPHVQVQPHIARRRAEGQREHTNRFNRLRSALLGRRR